MLALGIDARNTQIHESLNRIDNNNSSRIDFEEFLELMTTTMIIGNELTRFKAYFRDKIVSNAF